MSSDDRQEEDPGAARPGRAGRPDARQDPHLLQGHEAADRDRPGHLPRPGADLPGRADRRGGPGRPAGDPGDHRRPQAQGGDGVRQLALARRDRDDVRPGRHHAEGAN